MKDLDNLKTDAASAEVNEVQITEQECGIDKSPIENDCDLRIIPGESRITQNSTPPICSAISDTFSDARPTIPNPNKAIDNLKFSARKSEAQDGKMRWGSVVQILRIGRFDHAAVRPLPLTIIFQNQNEAENFLIDASN